MNEETLFHEARQKPAGERLAFLDEACGGDLALRRRIEILLQADDNPDSLLELKPAATSTMSPFSEAPGQVIGPYKLLEQIGEGGMGVVYMAEQHEPVRRRVALKLIKPGMDTRQIIARFEAERQALAVMDHPNIARVLDAGATETGRPYFVMELVRGVPITTYCDQNNLPVRERLELFTSVCQAIQHAHTKGIIHRDIKPNNVLVTRQDGRPVVKVIDFGVAKAVGQQLTEKTLFTNFAQMVGTPLYMSPEQAEQSGVDIDMRSDIYSLGVLLYELLTGSTPVNEEQMKKAAFDEVRRIIREDEPQPPSARISGSRTLPAIAAHRHIEPARLSKLVRGELDWIVMKALDKDRNRRYETANVLAADLLHYLHDEPVQACPPSAAYRLRKFVRRNRIAITTASLVFGALVLGTAVSTWQAIRATAAGELAQSRLLAETAAKNATREQLRLTVQAEDKANHRLFDARMAQANAGHLSRRVGQRFDSLNAVADATKLARELNLPEQRLMELRNAAIACLALTDLRMHHQWPGWPADSNTIDFDSALENYARADQKGAVSIRRVADDACVGTLPGSGSGCQPVFSPDGKYLATLSAGTATKIWKLGQPAPSVVAELPAEDSCGFNFSSDSRQCAAGHADGSISLYAVAPWKSLRRLPGGGPERCAYLAFHPEDKELAVARGTTVSIVDLNTEKITHLQAPARIRYLAWNPDGKSIAAACNAYPFYLWDVAKPEEPRLELEGHTNHVISVAFNHAGDLLVSVDWDGMLRLWDPRTGQQLFHVRGAVVNPRFSRDDRLLVGEAKDNQLGVWEVATGREYRMLCRASASREPEAQNVSIRFDGRLLAVGMSGGAGLWDLYSGRELAFIELPGYNNVLFEPSGALLTTGSAGLLRWPVRAEAGLLRFGPPQALSVPGTSNYLACSRDGRVIASAQFPGALVLHADRPDQPVRLGPHHDARHVAVSPDGQWVATGSHWGVKIWQAKGGELVKELSPDPSAVAFSPDGKWLTTSADGGRLWEVGSWREGRRVGSNRTPAFSPDGKIMAVQDWDRAVRLVDPETGHDYARLQGPHQDLVKHMSFSPDGTQLIVCNQGSRMISVWDLQAVRKGLTGLGLDWNLPTYPPAGPDHSPHVPVEIDAGDLAATIQAREHRRQAARFIQSGKWGPAVASYAKAIEATSESASAQNNLAWLLVTCPDATFHDPSRALELAAKATEKTPRDGMYMHTLGVAHYRAGHWRSAIASLEKSIELRKGGDSTCWFFLAMAHWQLDNKGEARKWHAQAVEWMDANGPNDHELLRFRAEAEALIKKESPVTDQESDVKAEGEPPS